jgi:hypothetical protein
MLIHKSIMITTISVTGAGCGPELDDRDDPPGVLEYETPTASYYRLDRRVDAVGVDPMADPTGCGFLTDRAHGDLVGTISVLDPNAAYDWSDCDNAPNGLLYLEGFTHSPFECNWYCCNPDLMPIVIVYFAIGSDLIGPTPNINGGPYVALEPDMPCPE